jgi:GLPGLI family protein
LPGMVLEVNINNGEQVITALSIDKQVETALIVKPKDGKKVTDEEFNKIVEEKLKEMGVEGGRPGVVIKIEND